MEEKIGNVNAKIERFLKQIVQLQNQVEDTEVKLQEAMKREKFYQNEFFKRVRYLYSKGETSTMALFLEANTFSEFLARYELARTAAKKDYNITKQWKKVRKM